MERDSPEELRRLLRQIEWENKEESLAPSPSKRLRRDNQRTAALANNLSDRHHDGTFTKHSHNSPIEIETDSSDDEIKILAVTKPLARGATMMEIDSDDDNGDQKPAAHPSQHITKYSATRSPCVQRQQFNLEIIDLTVTTPNQEEADAALARVIGLEINNHSQARKKRMADEASDEALARKLAAKFRQEEENAKAVLASRKSAMLKTSTGKAWTFVEGVLDVYERLSKEIQSNASPDFIKPIAKDDIVALTERMIEKQEEFRAEGKPCLIDLGFHYTQAANLASIQTGGLLTKQERDAQKVKAKHNGSAFGDGIYTAGGPSDTWNQRYGNVGILVARLQGRIGGVCSNTKKKKSQDQQGAIDTAVPSSVPSWAVLRSSAQCVALMQFNGTELRFDGPNCPSAVVLKPFYKALQRLINDLLNVGAGSVPEEPQNVSGWSRPVSHKVPVAVAGPRVVAVPTAMTQVAQPSHFLSTNHQMSKQTTSRK